MRKKVHHRGNKGEQVEDGVSESHADKEVKFSKTNRMQKRL